VLRCVSRKSQGIQTTEEELNRANQIPECIARRVRGSANPPFRLNGKANHGILQTVEVSTMAFMSKDHTVSGGTEADDPPDATVPARPLRSMHTGQNSIASENSLPQLGQVRRTSVLIVLAALQPQREPKVTPRSTEW
jgi:hypothetical protein